MRNKTSYEVVQQLASGRCIATTSSGWEAPRRPRRTSGAAGGTADRRTWYRYLTNVLDPRQLGARQIWALYGQRWTIEMSFAVVKRSLGLAYLRLTHQNGILIQIWCALAVYQILQDLRLDIAMANDWNEDEVSWRC